MISEISTADLEKLLDSSTPIELIDVREPYEYTEGHIRGSRLIPLNTLLSRLSEIDFSLPVYMICRSGGRSGMAAMWMASEKKSATNIRGGMMGMESIRSKYIEKGK